MRHRRRWQYSSPPRRPRKESLRRRRPNVARRPSRFLRTDSTEPRAVASLALEVRSRGDCHLIPLRGDAFAVYDPAIADRTRPPAEGDIVTYDLTRDEKNRPRATRV